MLASIIVSELPSNILLQKVGAPLWPMGQMGKWGLIALVQAWVADKFSLFATRFIFGVFEGGYVPGSQYVLSLCWKYKLIMCFVSIMSVHKEYIGGPSFHNSDSQEINMIVPFHLFFTLFYTREELAMRTAIFHFGICFAAAMGLLMTAGILQLGV